MPLSSRIIKEYIRSSRSSNEAAEIGESTSSISVCRVAKQPFRPIYRQTDRYQVAMRSRLEAALRR